MIKTEGSLSRLVSKLKKTLTNKEKKELLIEHLFSEGIPLWFTQIHPALSLPAELALLSLLATGQGERLLGSPPFEITGKFLSLLESLAEVERFYAPLGGIVGYHATTLQLLRRQIFSSSKKSQIRFKAPPFIDLSHPNDPLPLEAVMWGIEALPHTAEIYTAGGAADRLGLRDVPAALLRFCGKTLLEYLVVDLQAKEYLHYKLFDRQVTTPLAIMTSSEKENDARLLAFFEEKKWFNRGGKEIRLFVQPLVPALDEKGQWALQGPFQPLLKPGGHGVIWKLAEQEGIFQWLHCLGKRKALVRQINNIIPGVDGGLLAFVGLGCKGDLQMGFASCSRLVRTSEGINVLIEKKNEGNTSYCLTSIEYCDLDRYGLEDEPMSLWNPYSKYPANTNILFVDLQAVQRAVKQTPFPGLLVNAKKMKVLGDTGEWEEREIVRLESTMQNIADTFTEPHVPSRTYLTYNLRHKTISPIKRTWAEGALFETPEGCLYDILKNGRQLLAQFCQFSVPELPLEEDFLKKRVPFLFFYHPALGPLYSIIEQKLQKGSLHLGSLLDLQIADLYAENLAVEGSLQIKAEALMGHLDEEGILRYSNRTGKCHLKNVRIKNRGLGPISPQQAWKELRAMESCSIVLEEGAEFAAENVTLQGSFSICVPKNVRLSVEKGEGDVLIWKEEPLSQPTWQYCYMREGEKITVFKKKAS
jgi:UDP-N-acetylglucosamine pyrophosphorylase